MKNLKENLWEQWSFNESPAVYSGKAAYTEMILFKPAFVFCVLFIIVCGYYLFTSLLTVVT